MNLARPPGPILVVKHSRSGSTDRLVDALVDGTELAQEATGVTVPVLVVGCFDAGATEVLSASAVVLATPANFGYMSGAMKDFFERIYHPCLERTTGMPYVLVVKGGTDTSGAVTSVERIVAGLRWKGVLPPLTVTGPLGETDLDQAREIGATLYAGLAGGIF